MRKKALLAVAFASGLISTQAPVMAENSPDNLSAIEQIALSTKGIPELRARLLMEIACNYLSDYRRAEVEPQFAHRLTYDGESISAYRGLEPFLILKSEEQTKKLNNKDLAHLPAEETVRANLAIKEALTQAKKANSPFVKTMVPYLASCLYKRLGNTSGAIECEKLLNETIKASQVSTNPEQARAIIALLDIKSYCSIPLHIADKNAGKLTATVKTTEADFKASEQLKLQALSVADKLPPTEHVRRKAHRDLALWYKALGKNELADQQMQTLYKLVGFKDEGVLTPQVVGCGNLIWWHKEKVDSSYDCGMG